MMKKAYLAMVALLASLFAVPAMATGTGGGGVDYSSLTGAVDFSTTVTAILAVGALAVTLALAVVGIRKILRMIRSA